MNVRLALTDTFGRETYYSIKLGEPNPGSVVLADGEFGTAWQRHFDDGLWHCSRGGRARTYDFVLDFRNVHLVYLAADRATAVRPQPVVPEAKRQVSLVTKTISISSINDCPIKSWSAEHYRDDGSCMCVKAVQR